MTDKHLPTHYYLEVYQDSFANDLSYCADSTMPYMAISVGDWFNHQSCGEWQGEPDGEERFVIKALEHVFWTIEDSHNAHKIMLIVEKKTF